MELNTGMEAVLPHSRGTERDGQQRDVYVFDLEYLIAAADSSEHDRVQKPVRVGESGGYCRAGHCGDSGEYADGDDLL